jgi:2-oxoglutarate ferredoxin oxidoreductase subunit alpha
MLGLASAAEIPIVVVDVQRSGPSTGMPTKTEQGDLNLALFGGHGDPGRIVVALTSVEDAFYGTIRAFNYAERYQVPVIILSDAYLGHRKASINRPDLSKVFVENRLRPAAEDIKDYKRYKLTPSLVSPMAIPGDDPSYYTATGISHNEAGNPNYEQLNAVAMMHKRHQKYGELAQMDGLVRFYGQEQPLIGIVGWGSSEGVIREALARAVKEGYSVGAAHPKIVQPLPDKHLAPFVRGVKKLITVDGNYSGQFGRLIREKYLVDTIPLNKYNGMPFRPDEIYQMIVEVAKTL